MFQLKGRDLQTIVDVANRIYGKNYFKWPHIFGHSSKEEVSNAKYLEMDCMWVI
jgi:hypothetical protein